MKDYKAVSQLRFAAACAIFFHVAGLLVAVLGIRFGTAVFTVDERMNFVAGSPWGWRAAWCVWMVAAASFVWFMAALSHTCNAAGICGRLALIVGIVAASLDCFFDVLQIIVLPEVAARGPEARQTFLALAQLASSGGIVVANGLYAISVALMTAEFGTRPGRLSRVLGWGTFVAGILLSAVGFSDNPHFPEYFTGPAIGTYMLWVAAMALRDIR